MHRRTDTLLLTGVLTHTDIQKGWYAGMIHNTPFHWVCFVYTFLFVTLLILFITLSYTDKLCLYQSLFFFLFIPVTLLFLLIPVKLTFVYRVHQRPRGGEHLAGRYNAVERFLCLLRLSRFVVRVRFVGTSRGGWRSAR